MKKTLLTVVFSVLYITSASALGVNVGVSGNAGLFAASGKEDVGGAATGSKAAHKGSEHGSAAWGSIFVEKTLGEVMMIGLDYVPQALETDTTETTKQDLDATQTNASPKSVTAANNKVQIDFKNLTTLYVGAMVTENFYVKAGVTKVDIITNENLGTGSTYKDTDMDGSMFGFGYHKNTDNGAFLRVEGNYMSFDGAQVTSSANGNIVSLDNLDGVSGKISIGKTF